MPRINGRPHKRRLGLFALTELKGIEFGGWNIFGDNAYEAVPARIRLC
jgi:hypothetical protein